MLIGASSKRPKIEVVRRIKRVLGEALALPDDAMITVTQLACLEEDCAPLETVIGLLRPGSPQLQLKIHKATESIVPDDLAWVCKSWGASIPIADLEDLFKEI